MLLFLDLETTGLNPKTDAVLELAAIVLADDLDKEIARYQMVCEWNPSTHVGAIDPYVVGMHTAGGLWAECMGRVGKTSHPLAPDGTADQIADLHLRDFIVANGCGGGERSGVQLAGNSIHFDRAFMRERLPLSLAELHHRQLDVSSLNEFARRLYPAAYEARPGRGAPPAHRALADCEQSIAQARHYFHRFVDAAAAVSALTIDVKVGAS